MKYRIFSDVHLEFEDWTPRIMPNEHEMVLILAGDIALPAVTPRMESFLEEACDRFSRVLFCLGNHEHYHSSIADSKKWAKDFEDEFDNLHVLDDETLTWLGGPTIFGGTLWTDLNQENPESVKVAREGMKDYYVIENFEPEDSIALHKATLRALVSSNPEIVVTHHAPSYRSIHFKDAGDPLNCAYASDIEQFVELVAPKLWIHGHVQHSVDYKIANTRVIANPKGYPGETTGFNDQLVIEL